MSDNPLRSVSLITHPQKGGCILFAWGPPWNWKPSFQRSRMFAGWSITWLWWGVYWLPYSCSRLLTKGVYPRCDECCLHVYDHSRGTGPFWDSEETRFLCSDCEDEQRQAAQKPEV